jgi:hypothetical protein
MKSRISLQKILKRNIVSGEIKLTQTFANIFLQKKFINGMENGIFVLTYFFSAISSAVMSSLTENIAALPSAPQRALLQDRPRYEVSTPI